MTDAPSSGGLVSLVGAGPGDPELLTRRAARRLADADLVLFDGLVSTDVVALARRAQCFCVSKRAGGRVIGQDTINRLMIRNARQGKRVVRLKGGDPFVLGRGGEEVLALRAAGIPVEIVPGITAAVSAAGLAGIPVTHRGLASGFAVVSGHAPEAYEPALRTLAPGALTIVVLMGLGRRRRIAELLIACGWPPSTPAAIVLAASTPQMHQWTGTLLEMSGLAGLPAGPAAPAGADQPDPPGTIVIGPVVRVGRVVGSAGAGAVSSGEPDAPPGRRGTAGPSTTRVRQGSRNP